MMIRNALDWASKKLENKSTSAELDAEVLLSYVLQKPKEWLFANSKFQITNNSPCLRRVEAGKQTLNSKLIKFQTLIRRRAKGTPVAYLTNHKEFFGLDFYVDKRVLVPRPETEMLVEHVTYNIKHETYDAKHLTIVDVGTGSGCIAVALAKTLMANDSSRITQIYATDISKDALTVAKKNAKKNNIKIKFLQGNLLEPIIKKKIWPDIIVANLPYLKPNQIKGDIKYEPKNALVGGADGLKYYEKLLKQISQYKKQKTKNKDTKKIQIPNTKIQILIFEIDPSQAKSIKKMIKKYLPESKVDIKKDLAGLERMVKINY